MKASNEIRVGAVVIAALALMAVGYFFIRGLGLGAQDYYLQLNGPANVSQGGEVRLQGVKVGQVSEVALDATQRPRLTLSVKRSNPPIKLLKNYKYSVRSSSLIGENYVDIRGPFSDKVDAYPPGALIAGQAQGGIAEAGDQATALIADARDTLKELNTTIKNINSGVLAPQNQAKLTQALDGVVKLTQAAQQGFGKDGVRVALGDPRARNALNNALENSAAAARNLENLTADAGGVLRRNSGQLNKLLTNLNTAASNGARLTSSLNAVVADSKLRENSTLALNAARRTAENFEQASANINKLTSDPSTQAGLRQSVEALTQTAVSLRDTAQSIEKLATDETVQNQLRGTLTTLNQTTTALLETATSIKSLVADPETQGQIKSALTTLVETGKTLQKTAENLQSATQGFNNVIGDQKVQDDLKASVAELRGTLEAGRGAAERINSLLGGRKNRNSPAEGGGEKAQKRGYAPGGFDFTYRYIGDGGAGGGFNNGRNFGDATFNAELFGSPFRLGLANIGEGDDLTLQTGRFLGQNGALRYGVYRSKLGVGADYNLGKFSLEGNLYDPNRRSYNAYLGFHLTPNLELLAGREKNGGVRGTSIGVRLTP